MITPFDRAWKKLVGIEGDFSNHPSDTGGKTRWGITEKVARAAGYLGPMETMPLNLAMSIAREQYWNPVRGDDVTAIAGEKIADELLDTAYNMGTARAVMFLQRALNGLNGRGKLWADVKVDGQAGAFTLAALRALVIKRGALGVTALYRALNSQQGTKYLEIAEASESQEDFVFGWFVNRVS